MKEFRESRKLSFLMYYDTVSMLLDELDDTRLGKWLRCISEYELYGVEPDIQNDEALRLMVKQYINQLDRNMVKFQDRCKQNRDNVLSPKRQEIINQYDIQIWDDNGQHEFGSKAGRNRYKTAFERGDLPPWALFQE